MSPYMLISLLNGGGTILLFLAIAWLLLSFILLKIIFFPSKKYLERTAKNTKSKKNSKQPEEPELPTNQTQTLEITEQEEVKESNDKTQKTPLEIAMTDFSSPQELERTHQSKSTWTYTAKDAEALEIGTAFADELQRLGYEITSDTHETATATRDTTTLLLHIKQQKQTVTIDLTLDETPNS